MSDVNKEVLAFVNVVPELSEMQLVLVQNLLLQESARRLLTQS